MAMRPRSSKQHTGAIDRSAALDALDADELRAFVAEVLERLEPSVRGPIEDALLRRAATRGAYRPSLPAAGIVEEAVRFADAARRLGRADPSEVDAYLRHGVTASLAGEHAVARGVLEALLVPIAEGNIDLGQHEMVEEVLSIDLHDCVARYLLAVLLGAPAQSRAEAVLSATERVHGLGVLVEPVRAMEDALGRELPDRDAFLDGWIECMESPGQRGGEWESEHDRWLRDAVARREGTAGLARIARATKRPEALAAWCKAVIAEGDWKGALDAYDQASALVSSAFWSGEFLDGAAVAASKLGRKDATSRIEAAWRGAPSLPRLLRWLAADDANGATVRERATAALATPATRSNRLVAFLQVLTGSVAAAAKSLTAAPGLGWSRDDHPGHLLFPVFAWMAGDQGTSASAGVLEVLRHPPRSLLETSFETSDPSARLSTPSVLEVLERVDVSSRLSPMDRASLLDAMRAAAANRLDGVTGEKRRRHYDHAATLVACCLDVDRAGSTPWFEALRARTSRFPAFQEALRSATGGRRPAGFTGRYADGE